MSLVHTVASNEAEDGRGDEFGNDDNIESDMDARMWYDGMRMQGRMTVVVQKIVRGSSCGMVVESIIYV